MTPKTKIAKFAISLTLFLFGAASVLGFQNLNKREPKCEYLRGDHVFSDDETRVQRALRSTFAISTFRWLNPSTQKSILDEARATEARYPVEKAELTVQNGDLKIFNFSKLTPKFQQELLASVGQGVVLAKSDRSLVANFARESSTIAASNAKCFPEFSFERR
jgi:hypothetical protein